MIIFDWDGTLCDSVSHIVTALQRAAEDCGVEVPSAQRASEIIGLGLVEAMAQLFPDESPRGREALVEAYRHRYTANESDPPMLFPGAMATLDTLRERGFHLAVATGKSRRGLDRVLATLGLTGFFDATRCADETRSKPHPLMLQELMAELAMGPAGVVMVGDTEFDLEMAVNAGVDRVGVSFGVHAPERLQRHQPLAVVDTLPQLLDLPALAGRG